MATYTDANKQLLDRALNILFKQYIGVSATSLDNLVDPFNEAYTSRQVHRDPSLLWIDKVPTSPVSRTSGSATTTSSINKWFTSVAYSVGEYIYDNTVAAGDHTSVYRCTTGHTSGASLAGDISNWEDVEYIKYYHEIPLTESASGGNESSGGKSWYNTASHTVNTRTYNKMEQIIPFTYGSATESPYDYTLRDGATPLIQGSPAYFVDNDAGTVWFPKGTDEMNYPSSLTISYFAYRGESLSDKVFPSALPVPIAEGGTGATTQGNAAQNILPSILGTLQTGALLQTNNGNWQALAGNSTSGKTFLSSTGVSGVPQGAAYSVLAYDDTDFDINRTDNYVLKNTKSNNSSDVTFEIDSYNSGTQNAQLKVGTNMGSGDEVHIGSSNADVYIDGNTVSITGTTTSTLSETVEIADNIIELNSNITSEPREDAGFEVNRGTTTATSGLNTGIGKPAILWDESAMDWTVKIVNTDDTDADQTDVFTTNLGITYVAPTTGQTPGNFGAVTTNAMPVGGLFVNTIDDNIWIKTS